jgi:hypothetical protein
MPCAALYYLIDELGGFWNLTATNGGLLQIIRTGTPLTPPVGSLIIRDRFIAVDWALTVISTGFLVLNAIPRIVPPAAPPPQWLGVRSPNQTLFRIQVFNGFLQTVQQPLITQPVPLVGTIYNPDTAVYLPKFTQPGGPGTATFPQQQPGEMIGLFVAGCGHWFNNWDVISATVDCDEVAVMRCPLCQYVQRIIDPYSDIYSFQNEILIA